MEEDILRTNILSIAVAGLLIFLTGLILYLFRDHLVGYSRYVLPIPPLAVAAYIFVFNMYRHYGGSLPRTWETAKEITLSTALTALFFGFFTVLLVIIIDAIKR